LIDALATQIWEVIPASQKLVVFAGTYSEYRASKTQPAQSITAPVKKAGSPRPKARSGLSKGEQSKIQHKIELVEEKITALESQLKRIEAQLVTPPADTARVQQLGSEYTSLHSELDRHLEDWSRLVDELNTNTHYS